MNRDLSAAEWEQLTELQYPIDQRITNEMIMSTPDTWQEIRLDVEAIWHPDYLELGITLTSPEGRDASRAKATPELKAAVEDMLRLQKRFDQHLTKVTAIAKQDDEGWTMNTEWQ